MTALQGISHLLNPLGILTLYKSQIRPHLEYATLAWSPTTSTSHKRLDEIGKWDLRPIKEAANLHHKDLLEHQVSNGVS